MTASPEAAREEDQSLEKVCHEYCIIFLRENKLIAYMHNLVQILCLVSVYKGQCLCLRCDYVACEACHIVYFLYSGAVLCCCICCVCEGVSWICTVSGVSGASGDPEVRQVQVQRAPWWVCKSHPRPSGSEEELSS